MTSIRQIMANRQNALYSTGPVTIAGKQRSRQNAIRHGLLAETVIAELENPEDYTGFEAAVMADYDPVTTVDRELVLRLANVLWRLRRAVSIETGLFSQATRDTGAHHSRDRWVPNTGIASPADPNRKLTEAFLQLLQIGSLPFDRLSRYEQKLWRQSQQIIATLKSQRSRRKNCGERKAPLLLRSPTRCEVPEDAM